ncbi:hypothetical protein RchiOBHm_MTg0499011 (mitochondrion) [Rosa chinensis]|uniref:Uncharacterized protein n=1 Tax=Rosa chinensis TaxID=74649 RepID=A0A2P6P151_ROSCH|nr:hypothetical protein RchiOBHm_MTg0499011 [Rosa chinensis]
MEFQQLRGTCGGAQSSQRGDIEAGSVSEVEAKVIQFLKDEEITKVVYFKNPEAVQKRRTSRSLP